MSHARHDIKAWLADHPRLASAVFTTLILLSQVGNVLANPSTDLGGP